MANETITLISTVTVGAGGTNSISLSSIPQTYTDILITGSLRDNASAVASNMNMVFNSNTSAIYSARRLYGTGSGAGSDSFSGLNSMPGVWINSGTSTANTFNNFSVYIPNYSGSTNKSMSMDSVTENNATAVNHGPTAGLFASTAGITQIDISAGGNVFQQYSSVSIYGILKGSGGATVS